MRLLASLAILVGTVAAQTITVTSPTANQNLTGFSGFAFSSTVASAPSLYTVCYVVDAYPVQNLGEGHYDGCASRYPYSVPWNSFLVLNGPHRVTATAYDVTGTLLATSLTVAFTTQNTWPVTYGPSVTVATGTPITSNWSGTVTITPTVAGSGSGNSKTFYYWLDGTLLQTDSGITATSDTFSLDTTQALNGQHIVACTITDATGGTTYSDGYNGALGEWSASINFSNSVVASQFQANFREVYLSTTGGGSTFTLTANVVNTDGSTSSTTPQWLSTNTGVATVNQTSGLVTAVAGGNAAIYGMAPVINGTDLASVGPCSNGQLSSAGHPFKQVNVGELLQVISGTGWTPGLYLIQNVTAGGVISLTSTPCSGSASSGTFAVGPTRKVWAFVAPSATLALFPHFGSDGTVLTAYNSSKSMFVHSMFQGVLSQFATLTGGVLDQPYTPGFLSDMQNGGFNTIENAAVFEQSSTAAGGSSSSFYTGQTNYVTALEGFVSAYPKLRFHLIGDNFVRQDVDLWNTTFGPSSSWTTPIFQYTIQSWTGQANNPIGLDMQDEVNSSWDHKPLQGPITFSGTNSGLTSITSNGSTCTAHWNDFSLNGSNKFVITGATTSGFNNSAGSVYTGTRGTNQFTWPCTVSSGTYNSSTDSGLTLEPYGVAWYNGNSDFIHYNAFAKIRGWQTGVTGAVAISYPNAAGTSTEAVANWNGNGSNTGGGTGPIGGATQVADYASLYWTTNNPFYLSSRSNTPSMITNLGDFYRNWYGGSPGNGYNPALPWITIAEGTPHLMGFEGYSTAITSISGNVITFSTPHNVGVVVPGVTRGWISGSSNSAYNTNFYIVGVLSPMQLQVVFATTSFTGTGTGGTLTFANTDTTTVTSISASGGLGCNGTGSGGFVCADQVSKAASDSFWGKHRGQTFTISGNSVSGFNSNTFFLTWESPTHNTNSGFYRQLPSGSSTGGTMTIVADNNYVRGRNGSNSVSENNPAWLQASVLYAAILGASGERVYQFAACQQGYYAPEGLYGAVSTTTFQDTSGGVNSGQVKENSNPNCENGYTVPGWHAQNLAALLINRLSKYLFQPKLNSPDCGPNIECTVRAGAAGDLLMAINLSDAPQTFTFTLTPYLQSGQSIARFTSTWSGIGPVGVLNSGTASDTVTLAGTGGTVAYVFPATFAGEVLQPSVNARLADVTGATKVIAAWGYDQYLLKKNGHNVANTADVSAGVLPADRNIGPIYYRLLYLNSSNQVLATSDWQTL